MNDGDTDSVVAGGEEQTISSVRRRPLRRIDSVVEEANWRYDVFHSGTYIGLVWDTGSGYTHSEIHFQDCSEIRVCNILMKMNVDNDPASHSMMISESSSAYGLRGDGG